MGRFLTRDTWLGVDSRPLSFNHWGYVEGDPINRGDPSGRCPYAGCGDPIPGLLISPDRAHKIQENLWLLGDPANDERWASFVGKKYKKQMDLVGGKPWWLRFVECDEETGFSYDRVEIVIAIEILKEMSGFINDTRAQPHIADGLGRQFWNYCKTGPCHMFSDWTATYPFLNFLSYSESMTILTVIDADLLLPASAKRERALKIARSIRNGEVGFAGEEADEPYHFFCTNCTGGPSPQWMTEWLSGQVKGNSFGKASYSSDGYMQTVFTGGQNGKYFVILTPSQKNDLCGYQKDCIGADIPKPDWLNKVRE